MTLYEFQHVRDQKDQPSSNGNFYFSQALVHFDDIRYLYWSVYLGEHTLKVYTVAMEILSRMADNRKTFLNRSLADLGENGERKKNSIVSCRTVRAESE